MNGIGGRLRLAAEIIIRQAVFDQLTLVCILLDCAFLATSEFNADNNIIQVSTVNNPALLISAHIVSAPSYSV